MYPPSSAVTSADGSRALLAEFALLAKRHSANATRDAG
jgi:hypothetical protein